jgi:hypothetical protein
MRATFKILNGTLGIALALAIFVGIFASSAKAQCVDPRLIKKSATMRKMAATADPIVGFWKETMTAGDNDQNIPPGAVVDAGFSQWHGDGTEIHNASERPPATQSFCLGVWKNVGPLEYKLNHFALSWDSSGTVLVGPANIREDITLSHDHNSFSGSFTIDQYDTQGTRLAHITGHIEGKRITMNTTINDVL